ncbi:hypothetical protein ANME2D_00265 [Candidatus Methanoperedens nitroreducens]|uniref:Uncharacterized protein n=1 Tax=Candidatus Methanoperedens nitratireducens TaxID=1392998 RepID=A0A062VD73_9EURY|nr:hypothetical protein [Candidatus Methanoperedens nitroreducens]KCZ73205.1 hypothetical protein ANME2D_00265 [Candidatus Methanoperedens nitroreducens]MDJ1422846.1 hypothetical protein [Candidatus Methanoperedens sp.]
MTELFLVPSISIFGIHDVAVRDWLSSLGESTLHNHLEYPFKLGKLFPESSQRALVSVDDAHFETMRLLDIINPQAVFLDISVSFVELENKYNKRLISPLQFWSEYYQIPASASRPLETIYCIYMNEILDKKIRLIESKDNLPLSVVFYGQDIKTREELIPVYEDVFDKDSEFTLQTARAINEIAAFRETPGHIWYSPMHVKQAAISYEETEKFYNELLIRLERMLKFNTKGYIIKSLNEQALEFVSSYERFLDYKIKEDRMKLSNIIEGLHMLTTQSDYSDIVIFCGPMHYSAFLNAFKKEEASLQGITIGDIDITPLLDKIKPFAQKNRIMQNNYDVALKILGREKPERYNNPNAVLIPA